MEANMQIKWDSERSNVFVGRDGKKIIGRVADEEGGWEWASYLNGWTHDHGKVASFAAACEAVEGSYKSMPT
jgi:hypothetical protein